MAGTITVRRIQVEIRPDEWLEVGPDDLFNEHRMQLTYYIGKVPVEDLAEKTWWYLDYSAPPKKIRFIFKELPI